MLRYAMILSIRIEAFFAIFLCANNFHRGLIGKRLLQTIPFLRRVTNKTHGFIITCLKLAIKFKLVFPEFAAFLIGLSKWM